MELQAGHLQVPLLSSYFDFAGWWPVTKNCNLNRFLPKVTFGHTVLSQQQTGGQNHLYMPNMSLHTKSLCFHFFPNKF